VTYQQSSLDSLAQTDLVSYQGARIRLSLRQVLQQGGLMSEREYRIIRELTAPILDD
jgi:hypothetical protein